MKRFVAAILFILGGLSLSAQSFEEYKARARKEFDEYRSQREQDFRAYREKVNAEFAEYMRQAWRRYEGEPAVPEPPKIPDVPPVVLPELELSEIPDNEIPYIDYVPIEFKKLEPVPLVPLMEVPEHDPVPEQIPDVPDPEPVPFTPAPEPKEPVLNLVFYGTPCSLRFDVNAKIMMNGASEDSAADMWDAMCSGNYDDLLTDCLEIRRMLGLCDWAYYELSRKVSETVYGRGNEAVMLSMFLLNQAGYRTRLGREGADVLHLLVGMEDGIYNHPCFTLKGYDYYLLDDEDIGSLYVFDMEMPEEKSLSLSITRRQSFSDDRSDAGRLKADAYPSADVRVDVNRNLMDFYGSYPHPFRSAAEHDTWVFYAEAPLSAHLEHQLLLPLAEAINGMSQEDAANLLINFVQTAFRYMTDGDQWGYERAFFPEETLYYPYSDCEDRAILYARLVRELLGLDVVFLHYPGHLATAVCFDEEISGDHLILDGRKYLVCDPTYINAPIGIQMPTMKGRDVKVIRINN